MVEHQKKWCRFFYPDNAVFQPSKIELIFLQGDVNLDLKQV